jgi:hypothetical protein
MVEEGTAGRARTAAKENFSLARLGIPAYDALYRGVDSLSSDG